MTTGRPTLYTPELSDRICEQIAEGHSLRTICKADDMPCCATIFSWLRTNPAFLEHYEKAKEEQADALVEEMLDIADDGSNDWMEKNSNGSVGWAVNGEHVQRSRLRLDTRKWIASKLKAKKYGDKSQIDMQALDKHGKPTDPVTDQDKAILDQYYQQRLKEEGKE